MSRWHSNDCPEPEVEVPENGMPVCRACKAFPNLDDIIRRAQDSSIRRTVIPENTPIGSMNLSWPASLPWTRNGVSLLRSTGADAIFDDQEAGAVNVIAVAQKIENEATNSFVYSRRLSATQLRLLRLDPVEARNRERLIHVDLETHDFDDSPEYETVSYTWAGEEGDSTPRNPIYVGPYWDVLVQTDNCASMLRDLMPRGHQPFRRLWVDAICINQIDIPERDRQVSRMGDIYRNCMRVVVYLPVENPRSVRHPGVGKTNRHRTRLTEGVLLDLLRTRYFSRVWIIQELVLAPMVVFHLRDEDVYFSPLGSDVDWSLTRAPWVAHIANAHTFGKLRLVDVLVRTWNSEAADTRDKVFGVLGLLRSDTGHHRFQPDYSLSARDVFIGSVAYMILVEKQLFLLAVAVGKDHAALGYPSWSTDLTHQPSPFVLSDVSTARVPIPWKDFTPKFFERSDLYHIFSPSPVPFPEYLGFVAVCTCRCGHLRDTGQDHNDRVTRESIDCATGALMLDCIRIFREPLNLDTAPHPTPWKEDSVEFTEETLNSELILFQWLSDGAGLRIMVSNRGKCQRNYCPEQYTLMVAGQSYRTPVLLFLQPVANVSIRSYVLKHSFPIVGMTLVTNWFQSTSRRPPLLKGDGDARPLRLCGSLFETLDNLRGLLTLTLTELAERVRAETQPDAENNHRRLVTEDLLRWLFPGEGIILRDILPMLSQICEIQRKLQILQFNNDQKNSRGVAYMKTFLDIYKSFLETRCPDLHPRLMESTPADPRQYITFTYPNDRWLRITEGDKRIDMVMSANYDDLQPYGPGSGQRLIDYSRDEHRNMNVITLDISLWCFYLLHLGIMGDLRKLISSNFDVNQARFEVRPEHRDVYVHKVPQEARETLRFVWQHEIVTLV